MDLAQVAVEAQALHLQLLLDLLHLLLIGTLDENAGQLALSGCGQLGEDGVLGAVERSGVFVVVELLTDLGAEFVHGVHIGSLLGKITVQSGQLANTDVVQLDFEDHGLAGQVLDVVACREGDEDVKLLAALVAEDAFLEAGDHPAAAQLQGLVLGGAAVERLAFQQALVVDVDDVALDGRTLVRHQLSGHGAAALQHSVDLLVGDFRGDALGLEAGGLGQAQLRLQGGGGSGHKALVLLHADQVVDRLVHSVEAVFCHRCVVQGRDVLVHQIVDGVVPEGVLAAVGLDLGAVSLALGKALDGVCCAGALVHGVGRSFQLLSRSAESHFADTLFGSFHAYQFHRFYPPCCPLKGQDSKHYEVIIAQ